MRRDLPDDGKVVADEEDRDARLALKIDQQVDDLRLDRHVESGHRLVAYQQVRFGYHRARDGDALRLSAGKYGWVAIGLVRRQPHPFEPVGGTRAASSRPRVGPQ